MITLYSISIYIKDISGIFFIKPMKYYNQVLTDFCFTFVKSLLANPPRPYAFVNLPLQSSTFKGDYSFITKLFNITYSYTLKVCNYIVKYIKLLVIVSLKMFNASILILTGLIWNYNVLDSNSSISIYTVFLTLTLSIIVLYLMVTGTNNKINIGFTDKIKLYLRNIVFIMMISIVFIIPRSMLFRLADLSIENVYYMPCVIYVVLITSVLITWLVTLSMSIYKKNSFKVGVLHATRAVRQMDYMCFFILIIVTCIICLLKVWIFCVLLPSFILPDINPSLFSEAEVQNSPKNCFNAYSPLEQGEGKGKGVAYPSQSEDQASLIPRKRSLSPSSDNDVDPTVKKELKFNSRRRSFSPSQYDTIKKNIEGRAGNVTPPLDTNKFYNIDGKACSLTKSGVVLGYSDMPCPDPVAANKTPYIYVGRQGQTIKDCKNNLLGFNYRDEVLTPKAEFTGLPFWQIKLCYITLHENSPYALVRVNYGEYIDGPLCAEGHVHNKEGQALGVLLKDGSFGRMAINSGLEVRSNSPIIRPAKPTTLPTETLEEGPMFKHNYWTTPEKFK